MYNLNNKLGLIFDGKYVRHGRSTNNAYKRKSYSGQNNYQYANHSIFAQLMAV